MASINDVTSSSSNVQTLANATQGGTLGKEDFLKLLVAQLEHQDPLNPSDPTQFTAQLAQFSSLEQLFSVNSNLRSLASADHQREGLSALSLIGNQVIAKGGDFRLDAGNVDLGYELGASAKAVTLCIRDGAGRTVATFTPTALGAGDHFIEWDGRDQSGNRLAPGQYSLLVSATDLQNQQITASPLITGVVTGVDMDASGNTVLTGAGDFKLSAIKSVRSI